jgi:dTDP-4-dehydrorhamnose reductase
VKRILVTGASGLLGLNFCYFFNQKYQVIGVVNNTLLSNTAFKVIRKDLVKSSPLEILDESQPDIVLHCAAMANIDQCESFPLEAKLINSEYPGILAGECANRDIKFVHISTDAVFDGKNCGKEGYREDDPANPISMYAETKLYGEQNVMKNNPDAMIARVNFYGWSTSGKRSLVEFFYNNLSEGNQVNGFNDVFFCTLYVHNLADILVEMIDSDAKGIYHVFSSDFQSKYQFGLSIAKKFKFDPNLVKPVSWKDGGLTAKRSPNLIMNTDKLSKLLGHALPTQQECLDYFYQDSACGLRQTIQNYALPQ